ncbi:MAG: hypothetical protein G01um101438_1064 [Parcubacteria group bacterium Gr01-1014_38]|nr:MAG: hypothetical protein G01um101438_1064 [Parcubacteria group bacterium Gr01-1014_38]
MTGTNTTPREHPQSRIPRWFDAASPEGHPKYERGSVVETLQLGLNAAHEAILGRLETAMSNAVGDAIAWLRNRLRVEMGNDPTGTTKRQRILSADLILGEEAAESVTQEWIRKLMEAAPGPAHVIKDPTAARIAWGEIHERKEDKEAVREWRVNHLHPKFQLQQFFLKVLPASVTERVPEPLRPGLTQEVGQQLTSHLMLADSGTVRVAEYPTADVRDQGRRRARWEEALDRVCRRATPFPKERARDVNPAKYRKEDKRGGRLINVDPDWHIVVATPEPRRTPLLYVTGGSIRLLRRVWRRPGKRPGDAERVTRATFIAIPVGAALLEGLPPDLRAAATWWRAPDALSTFTPLLPPLRTLKPTDTVLVVPLAYGRKRTEKRVLPALTRLPIQWARIVHRTYRRGGVHEKWFLQLTIGYAAPRPFPPRVLGIHFGIDNVYFWALMEDQGPGVEPRLVEEGRVEGNPILAQGLAAKEELEWDQAKGRWVGGAVYGPALESVTHLFTDRILTLARAKGVTDCPAGIGAENIRWVPKGKGPKEANRRFSAWNYGQLRDTLGYKAPPAGVWATIISLTKADRQQDDAEQARRLARIGIRRLHDRRRRAEEKAREEKGGEDNADS